MSTESIPALRYFTVPADIDLSGIPDVQAASRATSFAVFFRDLILTRLPWGTPDQQETLEALLRLNDAGPGTMLELREVDHAALVQAMNGLRAQLTGQMFIAFASFFSAVARASVSRPSSSVVKG